MSEVLKAVHENLNVPGLSAALLKNVVDPALKKLVADTANKFDDIAYKALYPVLEEELNNQVQIAWDSLLAPAPPAAPAEPGNEKPKEGAPL